MMQLINFGLEAKLMEFGSCIPVDYYLTASALLKATLPMCGIS